MAVLSEAQAEACTAVLSPLYEAVRVANPGSRAERVAERALDYAINVFEIKSLGLARPPQFQIHDHLRNARHNVDRADRREARALQLYATAVTGHGRTRILGPVEPDAPEEHVIASDTLDRLRRKLRPTASAILAGMLADDTVATTASRNGLPRRSVERLRGEIRSVTSALVLVA